VFIFSLKKDGGVTYDLSPVIDRDGSPAGRWLRLRCEMSWYALPLVKGAKFGVDLRGGKLVNGFIKTLTPLQKFAFGISSITIGATTVVLTEGKKGSVEMADGTIVIVGDQLNQMNGGKTLEILFPNADKSTILKIRNIKTYASKGYGVIKFLLPLEEFTQFANDIYMLSPNKKEAERICPSLN
jgi:hypothetical protein